jgi:hypothetical protein
MCLSALLPGVSGIKIYVDANAWSFHTASAEDCLLPGFYERLLCRKQTLEIQKSATIYDPQRNPIEAAMAWEELYVDKWSLAPKGFNMIPGGFKGLRFLHKHRITDRVGITLKERDRAIVEYVRQNPRIRNTKFVYV